MINTHWNVIQHLERMSLSFEKMWINPKDIILLKISSTDGEDGRVCEMLPSECSMAALWMRPSPHSRSPTVAAAAGNEPL